MFRAAKKQEQGRGLIGRKQAFTFTAGRHDLFVRPDGEVLPHLGAVLHEKGLWGCTSTGQGVDDVDETGAIGNASRSNRVAISHDIEVRAFDKTRTDYLGNESGECLHASEGEWWDDAWTRRTFTAAGMTVEIDTDGYLDFHRRVLKILFPRGLSAADIAAAEKASDIPAGPEGRARKE